MTEQLTSGEITRRLHLVMDAARSLLHEDLEQVEGLIRAGEQCVAFENLCTQICEYEIRRFRCTFMACWPRSATN
jgi:hypothetical protein